MAGRPTWRPGRLVVWVLVWGTFTAMELVLNLYGSSVMWISLVWGLVEMPAATVVGAWLYKEQVAG